MFIEPVRFQLGEKTVSFKSSALATLPEGTLRIKNVSPFGVVYGGLMEFELTLIGADWQRELQKLRQQPGGVRQPDVPLRMQIGQASHSALARFK